jgi:hypothetical protein
MIITDGDSQEFTQLDAALRKYYPLAFRLRCFWHIMKLFKAVGPAMPKEIKKMVKEWLYSLPKDVETEEEYKMYVR